MQRMPIFKSSTAALAVVSLIGLSSTCAQELAPDLNSATASPSTTTSIGSADNSTVYMGRSGNFDVSVMLDSQGQHKLNPQEEQKQQEEQAKRHQQERETAKALANPQSADKYLQPHQSSYKTLDDSSPIAMTLTKQSLQLSMFDAPSAPATYTTAEIELEHPQDLAESFMIAGNKFVLTYAEEQGTFAITLTLSPLSKEQEQDFFNFENFKQALTQRFHDKEKMLYGEYTILDEQNFPAHKELTLKGYLKKSADGILPEMQNYFMERTIIDKGYLATITCEFRGSQAQVTTTSQRMEHFEPMCKRVLDSYTYKFLTSEPN